MIYFKCYEVGYFSTKCPNRGKSNGNDRNDKKD